MSETPERLESYLAGKWSRGDGVETELVDPVNGTILATVSARGLDLKSALEFARERGGAPLRELTFAQRGEILRKLAGLAAPSFRAADRRIQIDRTHGTVADAGAHPTTLRSSTRVGASSSSRGA